MLNSWSRPVFNLSFSGWRRLRRKYEDERVAPAMDLRLHAAGLMFSAFARLQDSLLQGALKDVEIKPPIFIVGHWRSGTTLLHELMALDDRLLSPTTHQCFNSHNFLLAPCRDAARASRAVARPTGDIIVNSSSPQEEEFAMLCRGATSPYEAFMFPGALHDLELLCDPDQFDEPDAIIWDETLLSFLRAVSYADRKDRRLILKSPANSFRIPRLRRLFPQAAFIHLIRDPEPVFASTVQMWDKMWERYAIARARYRTVPQERIRDIMLRMERKLEKCASETPPTHFTTIHYQDLVADVPNTIAAIYEALNLGDPSKMLLKCERYLASAKLRTRRSLPLVCSSHQPAQANQ